MIITKSISRFSRNTTDCLKVVRKLIDLNVMVFFEKENLNTGQMESELMLSVLSGLAENESVSISENNKWSIQKRFQNGTFIIGYPPYGYKNENGEMVIIPEQAEIVRKIFADTLSGKSSHTIAKELNIGPTHGQAYAVDLEDDDMTVWYSLAAAYNTKTGSSMFAASPRDAMDSYFLYSYKNVFYCGAGHSYITGIRKDNNDERYLFINIICNSVRLSVNQPRINIYDYKTEKNEIIKRNDDGSYETKVDDDTSYPDFSMKVTLDTSAKISKVLIYYDLDYLSNSTNEYTENANHILVADWNISNVQAGKIRDIWRYDSDLIPLRAKIGTDGKPIKNGDDIVWETEKYTDEKGNELDKTITRLKLQPSYFAPYNNEYTYLVIQVTDDKGNTVYQRIKIKLKPTLFDLT